MNAVVVARDDIAWREEQEVTVLRIGLIERARPTAAILTISDVSNAETEASGGQENTLSVAITYYHSATNAIQGSPACCCVTAVD